MMAAQVGATRRIRTGDLLITNPMPAKILPTLAYCSERKLRVSKRAFGGFKMEHTDTATRRVMSNQARRQIYLEANDKVLLETVQRAATLR
jgi:hypothetical protein